MNSICLFGDSTSWGAWDLDGGGWPMRLWKHIGIREGEAYCELYNCSISGGTTQTILDRFESEAKIRGADALLFQTGGNDAAYLPETKSNLVSEDQFRANIETIIEKAKAITPNIIFMDLKNCDESRTTPVSWINIHYTNESIKRYAAIMEDVCRERGVLFLDVPDLAPEDFEDGLHPNAQGHEKLFVLIRDFLIDQKWI